MLSVEMDLCVSSEPRRKRWTRAECEQLSEVFDQRRLELIEGELIDKMGKKRPHSNSTSLLFGWLIGVFGFLRVQQETPIDMAFDDNPTSEPQPDLIVLNQELTEFTEENPGPQDVLLVVEVAHSPIRLDLKRKAVLYARARIADYWVLDVARRRMIVHRDPQGERYRSVAVYGPEDSVAPLAAPTAFLRIGDAFVRGGR
jgi:hypothetical protein